jgi:DNA-binding transcriptional MocR family regulator
MPVSIKMTQPAGDGTAAYQSLADEIRELIEAGTLRVGDRIPSIRRLRQQSSRSISTVLHAYQVLEGMGLIEARPQSGYYVKRRPSAGSTIACSDPSSTPRAVNVLDRLTRINREMCDPALVPLGGAHPGKPMLPMRQLLRLERTLGRVARRGADWYEFPAGALELQQAIASHYIDAGCTFAPEDIVVTCGAQEALVLCLRAVAKAGDVVGVESPTYFGVLQAMESLSIRAVELPTHPQHGLDLDRLRRTLARQKLKALIVSTNAQNPLGFVTSDEHKRELTRIITRQRLPLIEDDVYGDLTHGPRPRTCKAYDEEGLVMLCSSFSKSLAPGMRIGWCAPGRWREQIERLKFSSTIASHTIAQQVIAAYIKQGGYVRHLRKITRIYEQQLCTASNTVLESFPAGTNVAHPVGGFVLWIELPRTIDAMALYERSAAAGISIAPGPIFSPSGRYQHHIRLSIGHPWSPTLAAGIRRVGELAKELSVR